MNTNLSLKIITPDGQAANIVCDSIRLPAADDEHGKNGGFVGIHPGHTAAMIALDKGTVSAYTGGTPILTIHIKEGFAAVSPEAVVIMTDACTDMQLSERYCQ